MWLLTNDRYITYQTGFSFGRLGHAPGVGLLGYWGWGQKFNSSKFIHIWRVGYSHEWHVQRHIFFGPAPLGPGEGKKGKYH